MYVGCYKCGKKLEEGDSILIKMNIPKVGLTGVRHCKKCGKR